MNLTIRVGALVLAGIAGSAQAGLLVPPNASDVVLNGVANIDDNEFAPGGAGAFNLTGFNFFGAPVTNSRLRVSNNGNINFGNGLSTSGGSAWVNLALPWTDVDGGCIAPLFDDLYLTAPGTGVASKSVRIGLGLQDVYVVTWQGEEVFQNTTPDLTFQVIMFGATNQFGAPAGTIMFCYGSPLVVGTNTFSFTTGLNKGDGIGQVPGIGGGGIQGNAGIALLDNSAITFIPDATGGYTVFNGKGFAPAPGTLALLGMGGLLVGRRRR